jgi:hypothetical protein
LKSGDLDVRSRRSNFPCYAWRKAWKGASMKVSIKDLSVDMEIKNSGIELDVYSADGSKHLGDLIVTKSGLIWCKGRTSRENGEKVSWDKFIEWMES